MLRRKTAFCSLLVLLLVSPQLHAATPTQWAVVIGISQYKNLPQSQALQYADQDARSFADLLKSKAIGVPPENVMRLTNEEATTKAIKDALGGWLREHSGPDDIVYVYFAGHGMVDDKQNEAYFVTYDTEPPQWYSSAYPMFELKRILNTLQYKHLILITDACHSANVGTESNTSRDLEVAPKINQFFSNGIVQENQSVDKSEFVLTAAGNVEKSFEGPQWGDGHGVFTYYLIEGLKGKADADGDGHVDAAEIVNYVATNVARETANKQHPTFVGAKVDYRLWLSDLTGSPAGAAAPPANAVVGAPRTVPVSSLAMGTLLLTNELGNVQISIDNNTSSITLDPQNPTLVALPPGSHDVKAERSGFKPSAFKITVDGRKQVSQQVVLEAEATLPVADLRTRLTDALAAPKPADGLKLLETLMDDILAAKPQRPLSSDERSLIKDVTAALADRYSKAKLTAKLVTLTGRLFEANPVFPDNVATPDNIALSTIRTNSAVLQLKPEPVGSFVEVDSRYVARLDGPQELLIAPGLHHIRVSRAGYTPETDDITVAAGETKAITASLKVAAISTFVFVETEGVQVSRDGAAPVTAVSYNQALASLLPFQQDWLTAELRRRNLTPQINVALFPAIPGDAAGTKLRFTKDRYKSDEVQVSFTESQPALYASAGDYMVDRVIHLDKLMGTLDIKSTPSGADVLLGGNLVGKTPLKLPYEVGDFELTIRADKTWKHKESISIKDAETISRDVELQPAVVFLGILSPNDGATKKPLIDPSKYKDAEALIKKAVGSSFNNYFAESPNPAAYEYTRDFLLMAIGKPDSQAELKRYLQEMHDRFESDLFLFGYFANNQDYLSNTLHFYLFSTSSIRPDSRVIRIGSTEIEGFLKELDGVKRRMGDLSRPYIGLTTLDTELTNHSLVALRVDEGSPAAQAGIAEGDSILTVAGEAATSSKIVQWTASHPVGSTLQLDIEGANGKHQVPVKSSSLPAFLVAPGTGNKMLLNPLIVQLDFLKRTPGTDPASESNVILVNQALAQMEFNGWNEALESLKGFQNKAANAAVLQAAIYYYRGLCFEQLTDKAHAKENFQLAVKEPNKQLPSSFFFDFQTLSQWRLDYLR